MGFFGGPSKEVMLTMALGIAGMAYEIYALDMFDDEIRNDVVDSMLDRGLPLNMGDLTTLAAQTVIDQEMGWYKRNQFLGMIYGYLVNLGVTPSDANYIKGTVEVKIQSYL